MLRARASLGERSDAWIGALLIVGAAFVVAFNPPRDWIHLLVLYPPTLVLSLRVNDKAKYTTDMKWSTLTGATIVDKKVWDRVAPDLVDCGMLRPIDAAALGRYCELLVVWVQCKDYIAKHGRNYPVHALPTVAERKAGKKQGPLVGLKPMPDVALLMRCSSELIKLERELGLTPSARTRTGVPVNPCFFAKASFSSRPVVSHWPLPCTGSCAYAARTARG